MDFRDDYFRQILEGLEETREEQIAEDRAGRAPDTIERVDALLAEYHRDQPQRLRTTLDPEVLAGQKPVGERLDELFVLRTSLVVELRKSPLSEERVLFLARSLLVGTARMVEQRGRPASPARLLARVLRQERIARLFSPQEVGWAWRVVFALESERGRWDRAEDALFHAIHLVEAPAALIERGIDFYKELEQLDGRELRTGGLSPEEVDRAKWELLEKLDGLAGGE